MLATVFGDLVLVPWQRPFKVPTPKVLGTWRAALGPAPLARLQALVLAAVGGEHRGHDYRAVHVGELHLGSIDGSVTRVPDTPANRQAFGSTGTADDSAPYPQVRDLLAGDASTRGTLAVVSGPSGGPKAEGEQALLDAMLTQYPGVFTSDRIWVLDRNFPGADRVARMLATGTHVLIRVKSDLTLPRIGAFLPDGSYCSYLTGAGGRWCLKVRVIEYHVNVDGQDVPEMFCLITDLHDYVAYPAAQLAGAYAWRWTGFETALKEAKSAIARAGPSAGPILRSRAPELIDQEHAAWICGVELVRALARAAARQAAPARKGRLAGQEVQPRQISFTAARRAGLDSIPSGAATASLPARHHRRNASRHPARPGQTPHRHRPGPAPRPQNQNPAGLPRRWAPHHHPRRGRPGQRLPAWLRPDRRRPPSPSPIPARNRRTWNRPPVRERHPGRIHARHSPQPLTRTITPRPESRDER